MSEKILVPDIGDFENVEVIELLVKEGQEIAKNDPVVTIESDKSSVEIPSIFSGKIESIKVKVGDQVKEGVEIITINSSEEIDIKVYLPDEQRTLDQVENITINTPQGSIPIKEFVNKILLAMTKMVLIPH